MEYLVCPKCGNEMFLVNDTWVCRVCGFSISGSELAKKSPKRVLRANRHCL